MLIGKLLRAKKTFTISTGESIVDLISSTFSFGTRGNTAGPVVVKDDEAMRPDLVADRIYADQEKWEVILKFNGISNPFSLGDGELLLAPPFNEIDKMIVPPKEVVEKGKEATKKNESTVIKPKTKKDQKRLDSIRTKASEIVPPNVNLTGAQNVKVVNGRVILGGDMTQANQGASNQTLSRTRVQDQLTNNNNF